MKPVKPLYLSYMTFISAVLFQSSPVGNLWNYLMNAAFVLVLLLPLISLNRKIDFGFAWLLVLLMCLLGGVILFYAKGYFTFVLLVKVIVIVYYIFNCTINEIQLIKFINNTYLLYTVLSIIVFIVFPSILYEPKVGENNIIEVRKVSIRMLQSIEGSASSLDTYSSIILVLNLSFAKVIKNSRFFIALSLIVLLWTFRLTPVLALILALFGSWLVGTNKESFFFVNLFIFIPFIYSLWLYSTDTTIQDIPVQIILNSLTHNRSMIWHQQLDILMANYSALDYILGDFSSELFSVQSYQTDGSMRKGYLIDNPHSSYLYLFFRNPLLFFISLVLFMRRIWRVFDSRWWPVLLVVLVGSLTNGQLLTLQNPIPLIILIYYVVPRSKSRHYNAQR